MTGFLWGLLMATQPAPIQDQPPMAINQSCQAMAGDIRQAEPAAQISIDGTTLKKPSDLIKIRKEYKDGRLIVIKGGDFSGWQLRNAKLKNICFSGSDFSGSDWRKARGTGLGFIKAKLDGAQMQQAKMPDILLRSTSMENTNASQIDFSGGAMDGSWEPSIAKLRIDQANLSRFRFNCGVTQDDGCAFNRQDIFARGANLTGADLGNITLSTFDISAATINGTVVSLDQVEYLRDAKPTGNIILRGGDLEQIITPEGFQRLQSDIYKARAQQQECDPDAKRESDPPIGCINDENIIILHKEIRALRAIVPIDIAEGRSHDLYSANAVDCLTRAFDKRDCLLSVMQKRRDELASYSPKPRWTQSDEKRIFIVPATPLPATSEQGIRELGPIIAGSAYRLILVKPTGNGRFDVRADLNGLGYPNCKIQQSKVKLAQNVVYTSVDLGSVSSRRLKQVPLLRFFEDGAEIHPAARNPQIMAAMNCDISGDNKPMMVIPINENDFDKIWEKLD